MAGPMKIVDCEAEHYQAICDIYNHYIENTIITFEVDPVDVGEMKSRVEKYTQQHPWLVGVVDDKLVGYAYATSWQSRCAYRSTVEVSCYLDYRAAGHGYGKKLYGALLDRLKELDCHTVIAGVALPNEASVKMQEAFKFEKVAHFKEVGFKHQTWIDVAYWQLLL